MAEQPNPRFNNATYVDALNPHAIGLFVESTYEKYRERLGDRFGGSIPSIFTDEPQFATISQLPRSAARTDEREVWTADLPQSYAKAYPGEDLVA